MFITYYAYYAILRGPEGKDSWSLRRLVRLLLFDSQENLCLKFELDLCINNTLQFACGRLVYLVLNKGGGHCTFFCHGGRNTYLF